MIISGLLIDNKNYNYKKSRNLVISYQIFYSNLFLELEQPFWIHPREQNRKLGIYGLPFGNKNDIYEKWP